MGTRLDLNASCPDPEGRTCEGAVVDVLAAAEPARVVVAFPLEHSPRLEVASRTELRFAGAALTEPIWVEARVVYRAREAGDDLYQFAISTDVAASMDVAISRRRSFRVQPDERMEVELGLPQGGAAGEFLDLSVHGASIAVGRSYGARPAVNSRPLLRFHLPGEEQRIELVSRVQSSQQAGSTLRLGVEFDRRATLDYAANEHRIAGYVLQRQVRFLRALIEDG